MFRRPTLSFSLLGAGHGKARYVAFAVVIIEVHYRVEATLKDTQLAFQPTTSTKLKLSVGLLYTLVKPPQTAD